MLYIEINFFSTEKFRWLQFIKGQVALLQLRALSLHSPEQAFQGITHKPFLLLHWMLWKKHLQKLCLQRKLKWMEKKEIRYVKKLFKEEEPNQCGKWSASNGKIQDGQIEINNHKFSSIMKNIGLLLFLRGRGSGRQKYKSAFPAKRQTEKQRKDSTRASAITAAAARSY